MTTLVPRTPYSDAELATLYPPQLRLHQVQVLLRHGERTPVNARFTNAGLAPFWPYCTAMRQLRNAVLDPNTDRFSVLEWRRRLETMGPNDAPVMASGPGGELDDICDMGMLTDRGRETTFQLGQRLRKLYVDQLGFLPAGVENTDFVYLRATPVPRALESLQQTLNGLYPLHTRAENFPPPTIISRTLADETLFPNDFNCRRFAALARAFAQRAAERWNDSQDMAYLNAKIGKWMPDESPRVAVDSRPRLSGIMDTINASAAHGPETKLPKEFYDSRVKLILEKIGVEEWYAGYKESEEYRRLGIGALLGDVVSRMVESIEASTDTDDALKQQSHKSPRVRLGLSGCHDTTLAGVLASLGAFNEEAWPPFTSHWPSLLSGSRSDSIGRKSTPELSPRERERLQGYFVRLRYNDRPVTIPGCKMQGKHLDGDESFCTLEAFKSIVDRFTPRDWKRECRANIKAPAFPAKPEPAGY
ncbi:Histidine phosphatase superfamily, clade-2 [Metarhizium album ARSEF 1941]|uniref:3-phytase n=1 Tax=Metarhizium album (strain ARSEF 1941) TaxID=1081103 RepID=A0A0B2WX62_METAS|nr:Histidine phosphatase superfamily, clade-2 [Metarhizium album ARSEF 1941]KHO00812.1 Histidine phosphatase superfamily, clade-2 [Metarhizium album ARSEF 1941]